jgi:Second Messenger Oligonucleotide or Dinucleotide Synthetase domain
MSVAARFTGFLSNISLTDSQVSNGNSARQSVVRVLNRHYYDLDCGLSHSQFIGSWSKHTRVRPPRDVDIQFILPYSVRTRFDQRSGNQQSQLLQEVRGILLRHFTQTAIRGDGPTVLVPLSSYLVELVPAFPRYPSGSYVCMTTGPGYYKHEDYGAQVKHISDSDRNTNGNTRDLIRMMKCWQRFCSVPLRTFLIELTAIDFLNTWGNAGKSNIYYDWTY